MIAGIAAGIFVLWVVVFAFALCRAASNWEKGDYDRDDR